MWQELLLAAGKGAIVGALIGYGTNRLAVWMLFHPRRPLNIAGWKIPLTPGLVVRNQDRLADAVGRAVARDLLDSETLVRHLREANLSGAIEQLLHAEYDELAASEKTLAEALGPGHRESVEQLGGRLAELVLDGLRGMLQKGGADSPLTGPIGRVAEALADQPLGDLLPEDSGKLLARAAFDRIHDAVRSPEFQEMTAERIEAATARFASSDAYAEFEEAGHDYISGRLPAATAAAQESLADYLSSPEFGEEVQTRFASKLYALISGKLPLAGVIITEKLIRELIRQRWPEISQELQEIARGEDLAQVLERQFGAAAGNIFEALREALRDPRTGVTVGTWTAEGLPDLIGGPSGPGGLYPVLEKETEALLRRPLRDLLGLDRPLPHEAVESLSSRLRDLLGPDENMATAREALSESFRRLFLEKPLREVLSWLPREDWDRAGGALAELLERRSIEFLPRLLGEGLRLEDVVSRKIREFDAARIEETIKRVSGRELRGIIRLGGLIGLLAGAAFQTALFFL